MNDVSPAPEDDPARDKPPIRVVPPKLYGIALAAGIVIDLIVPFDVMKFGWGWFFTGFFLASGGASIFFWALEMFRTAETSIRIDRPAARIVDTGPYMFSRNPIYIGLTLVYLGVALMFGSEWALVALAPVLHTIHRDVVLKEEAYLEKKFGDDYRAYKSRVRRWI